MFNRNKELTFASTFFMVLLCLFLLHGNARGNGAAWSSGVASAPPRPLKQNDLLLIKEHVVFKNGEVEARFWVKNPTKNQIHVTMGFPLEYKSYVQDKAGMEEYTKQLLDKFDVKVNGEAVEARLTKDMTNDYPIVINWEMNYPPQKVTEFAVSYPMHSSRGGSDNPGIGSDWSESFRYITHTGSYWAGPIKEALFEYCDKGASVLQQNPSGHEQYWSDGGNKRIWASVNISPSPYRMKDGCVVWERKDWIPTQDIAIENKGGYSHYRPESQEEILDKWCGLSKDNDYKGKQFSTSVKLAEIPLTKSSYKKLIDESHQYLTGESERCNGDWCDPFYEYPQHLKTDYELILLRYLRNSIFAQHGYPFKDEQLKQCFVQTQTNGQTLNTVEKANVNFIQSLEKEVDKINKNAWAEVNKNLRSK